MSTMVEPRIPVVIPSVSPVKKLSLPEQISVDWEPQMKRFSLILNARRKHSAHLTATELHKAHRELRLVYPILDEVFPKKLSPRTCSEATPVCCNLKRYLKCALDNCGPVLMAWVFFIAEEVPFAEYDQEVDRFQRIMLERDLANCRGELRKLLESKESLGNQTVYVMEDEIVTNISLALGELFNYRITTFAEMKELCDRHRGSHWAQRGEQAQQAVDELTIIYHQECLDLVVGQRDRMKNDSKSDFNCWPLENQNRFLKLCVFINQERLRWMLATRNHKRREYDRLAQGSGIKKQEPTLTEAKKDIYDHLLKILQEEEGLLKRQKIIFERISLGKAKIEDFGDALEDVDEMEVIYGKRKLLCCGELTNRLSAIYQRRAILRNKVQACQNALNKRGLRDSSVSFTGRLSGDSSTCMSLTTASEEALEVSRKRTLVALQEHYRGSSNNLPSSPSARANGRTHTISDTRLNVKAMSLT